MNNSNLLFALFVAILVLWAGLSIWRRSGSNLMQRIEESYRLHYLSHRSESGEVPPLVRWDFEQDTLVVIPPGEVRRTDGLEVMVVKEPEQRLQTPVLGIILARIPGLWFHGAFAAASLLLALLAFRGRGG